MPDPNETVTISPKSAEALMAVAMGDWTDDLNEAVNELGDALGSDEPDE